jgi:hypothetical protein
MIRRFHSQPPDVVSASTPRMVPLAANHARPPVTVDGVMRELHMARSNLGRALFGMVAGPEGPNNRARFHEAPGPRWFGEDRPIRRVHADASMFVGGLRALLLQSLHPLAMAGVAEHSDYRGDPWGRLQRTSTFLAVTTYGTAADARSTASVAFISGCVEPLLTAGPITRPIRIFWNGCTSPRWTAFCSLTGCMALARSTGGVGTVMWPTPPASLVHWVCPTRRAPKRSCTNESRPTGPS